MAVGIERIADLTKGSAARVRYLEERRHRAVAERDMGIYRCHLEGMSFREIARLVDLSPSLVAKSIARVREMIAHEEREID